MLWPSFADYEFFVRNAFDFSVLDPRLKNGKPLKGISGGFSRVYPVKVASKTFALRCWVKDVGNVKNRYEEISAYLKQVRLSYFVDFEYVSEGILVNGTQYPITRMEWADGVSLREFINQNLQRAHIFKVVADEFQKMVTTLHKHRISHGDLQDGNILIKQNRTNVEIRLIDYDSLFVPTLQGQTEQIVGLPEYQHPKRIVGRGQASEKVDYFSELVIYLSFLGLAEKPELWSRFKDKTERGLLFSKEDFENPSRSPVFRELANLSADIQQLTSTLKDFCTKASIDQLKPLEAILPKPDANAYSNRGDSFLNDGRYNEALAEFRKAIALAPNYEKAHYGIGRVYLHSERYTDAINTFEQLIKGNPNYKEAHHGLGIAYFKSGDNNKATSAANASLRIDPYYQPAHQLLDAIKSSTPTPRTPPSSSKSKQHSTVSTTSSSSTKPKSKPRQRTTNPIFHYKASQSAPSNLLSNVIRHITDVLRDHWRLVVIGTLGFALGSCFIILLTQMNPRNEVHPETVRLKNQLVQKESEIQALTSSIQAIENDKKELNRENGRLRAELEDSISAPSTIPRDVVNQLQQLSDQNQQSQEQLVKKNNQIQELQKEKAEILIENQRLQNEINESTSETADQNATVQQLQKEKAKTLTENQRLRDQLARRILEVENLSTRAQQLQNEKREIQRQNQQLQNENSDLTRQNQRLRNENAAQQNRPQEPERGDLKINPEPPKESRDYRNFINRAVSRNNQGCDAFKDGEYDKAIKQFRQAIKTESKFAVAHYNLGCTFLEMGEYRNAVSAFNKAVALNQKFKEAYYNRSLAYFRTNQLQKAKQDATKALDVDHNYQLALELWKTIEKVH